VGGVSERPTLVTKRRNPLTCSWSQRWKAPRFTGWRSPSRVAGETWVLVGPSCLQRGSFPCRCSHRRQQVSSGGMRRGTSSACARRTHSSPRCRTSIDAVRGHVLRSIQRPVHVYPHSTPSVQGESPSAARWGGRFGIAVGQTCASRRNRHRGRNERTVCGSPPVTASQPGESQRRGGRA